MKSALDRVDDTVSFIGTNTIVPGQYGRAAKAMVELFLGTQFPGQSGKPFKTMSGQMSLGSRPPGQQTDTRQMARAVYLLWEAMKWADPQARIPYNDAAGVPLNNINQLFEYTIYKALMIYDAKNNSDFGARHVLETVFRNNPLRFLQNNRLIIRGSSTGGTGPGDQNILSFYFSFNATDDRFVIEQVPGPGRYQFQASSIVATHWTAVPGRGNNPANGSFAQIHATELGGATIAITTQFTGCSLCFNTSGGLTYAAHIAPGGPQTPPQIGGGKLLAEQLCGMHGITGASFANAAGAVSVYGREHSNLPGYAGGYGGPNLQYFTMIGFFQGAWTLYAQENHMGGTIVNIRQIYP